MDSQIKQDDSGSNLYNPGVGNASFAHRNRSHTLHIQAFLSSVEKIESVFDGASHQKVWDHFTKAQRKNIQTWKTLLVVSVNSRPVAFVVGLVRWNSRIGFLLYTVRLGLYRRVQNLW